MKFNCRGRKVPGVWRLGFILFLFILFCENHIIERAASEYFPIKQGNWWRYANNQDALLIEVQPKDTILQIECYPISFSGRVDYFSKTSKAISKYIRIVYNFSGDDYPIVVGFVKRIELPLVATNAYQDSLCDSLELFGATIKAKYIVNGSVSAYEDDKLYGSVYKIILTETETLIAPETTIVNTSYLEEYYAPDIGLVRFCNAQGEYRLLEYEVH